MNLSIQLADKTNSRYITFQGGWVTRDLDPNLVETMRGLREFDNKLVKRLARGALAGVDNANDNFKHKRTNAKSPPTTEPVFV